MRLYSTQRQDTRNICGTLCLGWPEEPTVVEHIMDMGHDNELTNA